MVTDRRFAKLLPILVLADVTVKAIAYYSLGDAVIGIRFYAFYLPTMVGVTVAGLCGALSQEMDIEWKLAVVAACVGISLIVNVIWAVVGFAVFYGTL